MGARSSMTEDANHRGDETGKHPDHFLAEWMEHRGYSVRGLATELNVSHSKISRINTGDSELRPSFAKKVARFFNVPMTALYTLNPLGRDRETVELLEAVMEVDPANRPAALRMLRSLRRGGEHQDAG